MPKPATAAPKLQVPLLSGGPYTLADQPREVLIVFYRGVHCPACRKQLEALVPLMPAFEERGIDVVAISMDEEDRAQKTQVDWAVDGIPIGYAMPEKMARDWGLWISERVVEKEPPIFSEAALTWVGADGTILAHWQQSVPFARPPFDDILSGIDFVRANGRPPRGAA
ncbi:thioredoxin peroxidase [Jannaschia pagri]|uniref:Thioredoxin peroxidase n=1 Tax=Jannaschia pagri TaxID=2829797 RepID=A0ABQ4NL17_9RHOB|nr:MULTISPECIES: redoxin domain-containing protein [unclassified Jannaschia]GIT91277.1 thioredoxin peroxidase [Jannaschia sp. AI_61]GIT95110.1 thioredoxin peroxidase [Jannaschia sp. AI_62]